MSAGSGSSKWAPRSANSPNTSERSGAPRYGSVDRVSLSLPIGFYVGMPGYPEIGGEFVLDNNASNANSTVDQAWLFPLLEAAIKGSTFGPVRAIAIAPDSPIACCDLWLNAAGISTRHRISPGRPLIGDLSDVDAIQVSLPNAMPDPWDEDGNADTQAQFLANNFVQDASLTAALRGAVASVETQINIVRLELWRGEVPPFSILRRSPYQASMWYSDTASANSYGRVWLVTDGRSRITVDVRNQPNNATLRFQVIGGRSVPAKRVAGQTVSQRLAHFGTILDDITLQAQQSIQRVYTAPFDLYSVKFLPPGQGSCKIIAEDA